MSNFDQQKCPGCGTVPPPNSPEGLCPRCLAALNFASETSVGGETPPTQPPLTPAELAPHFPQLEILECLGRGGMGVVYKARQKSLNRFVALKLLAPERVQDSRFAERFAREAQALARLNHPNIVTIHDFGQAGGFYFLLMEYVDGVNLRQVLRGAKLQAREALAIVPPICEALQYAHDHGIVHRDIKPENLLLDKSGRAKIADFGIATMLGASPSLVGVSETQAVGTPQYMAPEQRTQGQTADHRADVFSLGVVLYELLTGELPSDKQSLASHIRALQIDVRLDEIVLRALEKNPAMRFQTAAEFGTRVEAVATSTGSKASLDAGRTSNPIPGRAGFTQPASTSDKRIFAFLSLGLLLLAVLVPFIIAAQAGGQLLGVGFGMVAGVLALIFGLLSWSEPVGKTVALLTLFVLIPSVAWYGLRFQTARSEATTAAEIDPNSTAPPLDQPALGMNAAALQLDIATEDAGPAQIKVEIRATSGKERTIKNAEGLRPGPIGLPLSGVPDGNYFVYLAAPGFATQWQSISVKDEKAEPASISVKLYRKRYVVLRYAFNTSGDREFSGAGTKTDHAAVAHWGGLPYFQRDWQVWQKSAGVDLFGRDPYLEFHRFSKGFGFARVQDGANFDDLKEAPSRTEYECINLKAEKGLILLCRVQGDREEGVGYGKLLVEEITETPPPGVKVIDSPAR